MIAAETIILWIVLTGCAWLGARRAGSYYGVALATLCLAFWFVLSGMPLAGPASAMEAALFAMAAAVMLAVGWLAGSGSGGHPAPPAEEARPSEVCVRYDTHRQLQRLQKLCDLPDQFGEWLEQYRHHVDPWPAFDHHIRTVLAQTCGAKDVRTLKVLDNDLMLPLTEVGPHHMEDCLRANQGIVRWVVDRAGPYYAFAAEQDEAINPYLEATPQHVDWCFPVVRARRVVGVVSVGALDRPQSNGEYLLKLVAGLISEQWGCVTEIFRARVAAVTDQSSGLLTRGQFFRQAPLVLEKSQRDARPVSAAVFALEGLHRLDAMGFWGLHDAAVASVGRLLRQRLTPQDCASRFDDTRFMVLWDGKDAGGTQAAVREISRDIEDLFEDRQRWRQPIRVSCGLASTGNGCKSLQSLLNTALSQTPVPASAGDAPAEDHAVAASARIAEGDWA